MSEQSVIKVSIFGQGWPSEYAPAVAKYSDICYPENQLRNPIKNVIANSIKISVTESPLSQSISPFLLPIQ
jgi:hypothetical protein